MGSGLTTLAGFSNALNAFDGSAYPNLAVITVASDHPVYCVENGLLIDRAAATVVSCPAMITGDVAVPDWITTIGDGAFSGSHASSVYLPDSVTEVRWNAFAGYTGHLRLSGSLPVKFMAGNEYVSSYLFPEAISDERMQHFMSLMRMSTQRKITSAYKILDPAKRDRWVDAEENEATYPALKEGKTIWVLRENTTENNMRKLAEYFAEAGYTEADLAADILECTGKTLTEAAWYEQKLALPYSLSWYIPDSLVLAEGCEVENLPGALSLAWAVENKVIPAGLLRSGDYAYTLQEDGSARVMAYMGKATSVTVPDTLEGCPVTAIAGEAFLFGENVTSVFLPDSVTELAPTAFQCCEGLTEIRVTPDHPSLASIDGVLFEKTTRTLLCYPEGRTAESYEIPQGIRAIAPYAFSDRGMYNWEVAQADYKNEDGLKRLILPDSVTEIAPYACYGNTSINGVEIGAGVETIGDYAFYSCDVLREINIPGSVRSIGKYAFAYSGLYDVTMEDGVTSIGRGAFNLCEYLREVTIPDSVTELGGSAFSGCRLLAVVHIGKGVTRIGENAFSGCAITEITVPDSVTELGDNAFAECTALAVVNLGEGVTRIGDGAFRDCGALTGVTLPEGVTYIGDRAFYKCASLTGMAIPGSVTYIGDEAFRQCSALADVTFAEGVTHIGWTAFYECGALEEVTLPASLELIDKEAFDDRYLRTVNVQRDTYAAQYCRDQGLPYTYPDALDWLSD